MIAIIFLFSLLLVSPDFLLASDSGEGKRLYLSYCAVCHGIDGRGDGRVASLIKKKPVDLTQKEFLIRRTDQQLRVAISGKDSIFHGTIYLKDMKVDFSQSDVFDLINYIRSFQTSLVGNPIEGRKLYVAYCSGCHGRSGQGNGDKVRYLDVKPKDQSDDTYMSSKTDEELFDAIKFGGGAIHGARFMPQWQEMLRPQEIWDIVSYTRMLHRRRDEEGDSHEGSILFAKYCALCHGDKGDGHGPVADILTPHPESLIKGDLADTVTDQDLFFTILGGGKAMGLSAQMPAWGDVLSERDVWNILKYIRTLE